MKHSVVVFSALLTLIGAVLLSIIILAPNISSYKVCNGRSRKVCSALPMCKPLYSGGSNCDDRYCFGIVPPLYIGCTNTIKGVDKQKYTSVVVTIDTDKGTKEDFLKSIEGVINYEIYYDYKLTSSFAMHIDSLALHLLQNNELVKKIQLDKQSPPLN